MFTHAFFKALLFLGSGSVIHGVEHGHHSTSHTHPAHADEHDPEYEDPHEVVFDPQDMRNMGGLRNRMPITYWTYLVGTLALAGIWPFAGFWSKDEILADSWLAGIEDGELKGFIALGGLLLAAGLTAFYMWRQVEMVFHGEARTEAADHAHESPPSMTIPLVILALGSIIVGFFNLPSGTLSWLFGLGLDAIFGEHSLASFLEYSVLNLHVAAFQPVIALAALSLGVVAIFTARSIYGFGRAINEQGRDPLAVSPSTSELFRLSNARLYWDEFYDRVIIRPFTALAKFLANTVDWEFWHDYFHNSVLARGYRTMADLLANPVDLGIIDGAVNGVASVMRWVSGVFSRGQTGYVRTYALMLFLGAVAVIVLILIPLIQV
jgi:NADH-quinone oxidoreductase subunit L